MGVTGGGCQGIGIVALFAALVAPPMFFVLAFSVVTGFMTASANGHGWLPSGARGCLVALPLLALGKNPILYPLTFTSSGVGLPTSASLSVY